MASSNRHWPSMFKSKPSACSTHHQWQHDINPSLVSNGSSCHRPTYTTSSDMNAAVGGGAGCEERSPEPKPRWNPKPEQIRILEAIFNSGMVNPPRDEIRKIRAQLQEYGQVGDANVFYWFQNRKSRSKHKLRHQQLHHNSSSSSSSKQQQQQQQSVAHQTPPNPMITSLTTNNSIINAAPSSSSSSSEKSSPKLPPNKTAAAAAFSMELSHSPTASVNQQKTFFQAHHNHDLLPEPFFFPMQQSSGTSTTTHGFCFSDQLMMSNVVHHVPHHHDHPIGPCTSLLLSEIMNHGPSSRKDHDQEGFKAMRIMDQNLINYNNIATTSSTSHATVASHSAATNNVPVPSPMSQIQGVGEAGAMGPGCAAKSTVFINDVAFEVAAGPFNVREAFGDDAVLIHSSGQPVLTNEWGVTLHSLHHGAFYYLI